jgi:uridine kinase
MREQGQGDRREAGPRILAIAGGSCSGKTTLADVVFAALGPERSLIVRTDNYYRADLLDFAGGGPVNFDVPAALDFDLLRANLSELKEGRAIEAPLWDFVSHRRRRETMRVEPRSVIVVEGIFALHSRELNAQYDYSCFIECPEDKRLERRIVRDVAERGRTEWSVREQFEVQVAPMHDEHVEPTKYLARRIVSQNEYCASPFAVAESMIAAVTGEDFRIPGDLGGIQTA